METLKNKIETAIENGTSKILDLFHAEQLIGKKIITKYFGYTDQDGIDCFILGEILSKYQIAEKNIDLKAFPQGSQAKYWESYMTSEQLHEAKNTMVLITSDGRNTFINAHPCNEGAFTCSDIDRFVSFIIIE